MKEAISRHNFLQSLARKGMLLGLGGVGLAAVHGTKTVSECFNHTQCTSCWVHSDCALPEKKEVKNERAEDTRQA